MPSPLLQTPLLHPKSVTLADGEGKEHTFLVSKIPAVQCREIVAKYPLSALPRLGDYSVNEETMLKLMCYVGIPPKENQSVPTRLVTVELVNNHVADFELLARLEMSVLEYNCSFLRAGKPLFSLEWVVQKARELFIEMLTASSQQSSPQGSPPLSNSKAS